MKIVNYKFYKDYLKNPKINEEQIFIEIPYGKWKISIQTSPMKLEHINLINNPDLKEYHDQHCRFLSFTDAFYYIKAHDEMLMEKIINGNTRFVLFD